MANNMKISVKIVNLKENSFKKFLAHFPTSDQNKEIEIHTHINSLYSQKFETDDISISWMNENVGSKSISILYEDGNHFMPEVIITIDASSNIPSQYLKKLSSHLTEIDENIVLFGTYVEENYENIGAFIYGKNNFEDSEDLYPEVDLTKMFEDEEYNNEVFEKLIEHRDSLYEGYQERLKEEEEDADASNASIGDLEMELYFWDDSVVTQHQGKEFMSFVADLIKGNLKRTINKHSKIGMTADGFPIYFEENTLKLRLDLFKNFENNKAIQTFITIGTKLPKNNTVKWNAIEDWGLINNDIIDFANDFYLLINDINDGACEKLAQIKWQVFNSMTNKSDDYEVNIYIDKKTKAMSVESSIGY
jgi:hypothetical protein